MELPLTKDVRRITRANVRDIAGVRRSERIEQQTVDRQNICYGDRDTVVGILRDFIFDNGLYHCGNSLL